MCQCGTDGYLCIILPRDEDFKAAMDDARMLKPHAYREARKAEMSSMKAKTFKVVKSRGVREDGQGTHQYEVGGH